MCFVRYVYIIVLYDIFSSAVFYTCFPPLCVCMCLCSLLRLCVCQFLHVKCVFCRVCAYCVCVYVCYVCIRCVCVCSVCVWCVCLSSGGWVTLTDGERRV